MNMIHHTNPQVQNQHLATNMKKDMSTIKVNIILQTVCFLANIFCTISLVNFLKTMFGFSETTTVLLVLTSIMILVFLMAPCSYFGFVYGELCTFIMVWCECIVTSHGNVLLIVQESKHLIESLRTITRLISHFVFWMILMNLIMVICIGYCSFSIFLEKDGIDVTKTEWYIGVSLYFMMEIMLMVYLNTNSEKVLKKIQTLEEFILDLPFKPNEVDYVLALMARFQGFDGNGFFTLNHSMLSSITATFINYFVIIFSFRMNET